MRHSQAVSTSMYHCSGVLESKLHYPARREVSLPALRFGQLMGGLGAGGVVLGMAAALVLGALMVSVR